MSARTADPYHTSTGLHPSISRQQLTIGPEHNTRIDSPSPRTRVYAQGGIDDEVVPGSIDIFYVRVGGSKHGTLCPGCCTPKRCSEPAALEHSFL